MNNMKIKSIYHIFSPHMFESFFELIDKAVSAVPDKNRTQVEVNNEYMLTRSLCCALYFE